MLATLMTAAVLASAPRIAILPLTQGDGVTAQTAESVAEALTAELRKLEAAELINSRQIGAVIGYEAQRELMACKGESCFTELAGAIDASQLVTGTLSRLGQSWLLQVQRLDARDAQVLAHGSAREQGGVDKLLDQLPRLARELFAGLAPGALPRPQATAPVAPAPSPVAAAPPPPALPPPTADLPLTVKVDRASLLLLSDGAGRYVAVTPVSGTDGPLFAGTEKALYLQRLAGSSRSGDTSFGYVFWDPRGGSGARRSFSFQDGKYELTCGSKSVPLTPVPTAKAKKLLTAARLHDVRWQRSGLLLARDDDGGWYFVDEPRVRGGEDDFRVYLGEPGELRAYPARALARDSEGEIFRVAHGRLKFDHRAKQAEWSQGEARRKLTVLDLYQHAPQVYGPNGPFKGLELGTPCDGHF